MANLSNINNILRTGSLGVGINRDPLGAFEISSATKPGVKMFNTSTNGKTYEAYSDTNGNYIIYDQDADDNRFVINTSGNATFAGNVSITKASTPELILTDTTNNVNLLIAVDDANTFLRSSSGAPILFQTNAGTTALTLDASQNSTFTGQVSVGNYAIPSDHQFQIAHLGQAYARFALTNSQTGNGSSDGLIFQMENLNSIIKNQENGFLAFGTNGRETDLRIDSSGNVGINYTGPFNQISGTETTLAISNSNIPSLYLNNSSTNGHNYILLSGTDGAFAIYDKTVGANRFIIDSSGAITTDVTGEVTIPFYIDGYRTGIQQVWLNNSRAANSSNGRGTKLILGAGNTVGAYFTHYTSGSTGNGVLDIGVQYTGVTTQSGLEFNTNSNRTVLKSVGNSGYTSFQSSDGTERMRITSGGEVGIGTNFVSAKVQIHSTNAGQATVPLFIVNESTTLGTEARLGFAANTNDDVGSNRYSYISTINTSGSNGQDMVFATNATGASAVERMRITSGGYVFIGGSSNLGYNSHNIKLSAPSSYALIVRNSDTSTTNSSVMQFNRAETTATTGGYCVIYRQGDTSTGTNRWIVFANGNIQNTNNSYGSLSDERKKENIVDATPKLDDLMKVKVRNFNLKGEETKQIGVVAQELEEVFPGMIDESKTPDSEDETLYKGVKYSVFVPILIKAIQELKADNDSLKARIETLENK